MRRIVCADTRSLGVADVAVAVRPAAAARLPQLRVPDGATASGIAVAGGATPVNGTAGGGAGKAAANRWHRMELRFEADGGRRWGAENTLAFIDAAAMARFGVSPGSVLLIRRFVAGADSDDDDESGCEAAEDGTDIVNAASPLRTSAALLALY